MGAFPKNEAAVGVDEEQKLSIVEMRPQYPLEKIAAQRAWAAGRARNASVARALKVHGEG
jgi:hypothetical protein